MKKTRDWELSRCEASLLNTLRVRHTTGMDSSVCGGKKHLILDVLTFLWLGALPFPPVIKNTLNRTKLELISANPLSSLLYYFQIRVYRLKNSYYLSWFQGYHPKRWFPVDSIHRFFPHGITIVARFMIYAIACIHFAHWRCKNKLNNV